MFFGPNDLSSHDIFEWGTLPSTPGGPGRPLYRLTSQGAGNPSTFPPDCLMGFRESCWPTAHSLEQQRTLPVSDCPSNCLSVCLSLFFSLSVSLSLHAFHLSVSLCVSPSLFLCVSVCICFSPSPSVTQQVPLLGLHSKELKAESHSYLHTRVHSNAIPNSRKVGATPVPTDWWTDKQPAPSHTEEYYSVFTVREILTPATTWVNPEDVPSG